MELKAPSLLRVFDRKRKIPCLPSLSSFVRFLVLCEHCGQFHAIQWHRFKRGRPSTKRFCLSALGGVGWGMDHV
ncbi:hypothetical protein Mapa_007586 [Marchantia paleacea]|nr:hypothetical protein Mapa_007586 [Marchantia paleacea]